MTTLDGIEHLNMALLELDELAVALSTADDIVERELWLARVAKARGHVAQAIRNELSTALAETFNDEDELKGYDC